MLCILARIHRDDSGALISTEFLLIATILLLGIIVGLVSVREAVSHELVELANATLALSQEYTYSGISGCCATIEGGATVDTFTPVTDPTCTAPTTVELNSAPCGEIN